MDSFEVRTPARECMVEISAHVSRAVKQRGINEGLCTVFVPHTTAGVTINENADPDVRHDMVTFLSEMIPVRWPYRHGEGNSDAHIKASLVGSSVQVPLTDGKLALGTWQGIFLAEFDGARTRKVYVVVHGA